MPLALPLVVSYIMKALSAGAAAQGAAKGASALANVAKSMAAKGALGRGAAAINRAVPGVRNALSSAGAMGAARDIGRRLSRGGLGRAVDGIVSAAGLPYLGMNGGGKFMDAATYFFLSRYLPQMMQGGGLGGTSLGQLLALPLASGGGGGLVPPANPPVAAAFPFPDDDGGGFRGFTLGPGGPVITPRDERGYTLGPEGPLEYGPNGGGGGGSGGPVGRWFGGLPGAAQRIFGWGGSAGRGGWSAEELLAQLFEDPMAALERQVSADTVEAEDPFLDEGKWRDFLRKQRRKDVEFDRKLDKEKQKYIDKKMKRHYRKPVSQWGKELGTEAVGRAFIGAGEAMNIYNSALANALMKSASSSISPRQAEMYGNPIAAGMSLMAGGRQALGGIANVAGKQAGNFFRTWSDSLKEEFNQNRIMRLQLDNRQPGQVIDTLGRIGMRQRMNRRD